MINDNQLKLASGKIITFNSQQIEGLKKINAWLKNKDSGNFFTLSGYAGTGKSTIIKKILDGYRYGVVVSAPTHKAVKNVTRITKKKGQTLHKLLGLRPDVELENFSPNFPQFSPIAIPRITDHNFVIIDECSMINIGLFDLIKENIIDSRTKVLFMGDSAQLPPVGENISVVFTQTEIEIHELTKVERQDIDNPLMDIYGKLRNNLSAIDGGFKRIAKINELGEGIIFTVNKRDFREQVFELFTSEEYQKNSDYCKGLAWKNETVMKSNEVVRNKIFGNDTDIIELNDIVMGYRSISDEKQRYNIIENSTDYKIISKSDLEENTYGINGYRVKLREELNYNEYSFQDVFIIDANNHENLHLYAQMHDFFRDMGKSNKKNWRKYYEFRRSNILMKNIDKHKNGLFRSSADIIKRDIDYGYFLTIHKSQGSTYQYVTVIESDINNNWNIVERNKLKYVAFSRPEKKCIVLSDKVDF